MTVDWDKVLKLDEAASVDIEFDGTVLTPSEVLRSDDGSTHIRYGQMVNGRLVCGWSVFTPCSQQKLVEREEA